uniref:Uncharacterized protein n=1 Tax=Utricularia reniformis TaxID=192314 RepID=A0A1Y0B2V9_9LAMI|nr:hypothetical protein AEK19_MT1498 [Utricularia reniformis]ART31689.1 hypothetical protein AEK19_MT1498 [Utricularia reniformis]
MKKSLLPALPLAPTPNNQIISCHTSPVRFSDGEDHSPQNRRAVNKLSGDKYDVADLDPKQSQFST